MPSNTTKVIAYSAPDRFFEKRRIQKLEALGYTIIFCRCAEEVLGLFSSDSSGQPGILITDIFLTHGEEFSPEETNDATETGLAIYLRVRASHPNLPVILLATSATILGKVLRISGQDSNLYVLSEDVGKTTNYLLSIAEALK